MGARTPKTSDRRVQRTRRTLRQALIALLLERGWDAVSVQDVCERADVGRSTFYTHFADKEELLVGGLDDLAAGLRGVPAAPGDPLPRTRALLHHAWESHRLFRALVGKRSGEPVLRHFRELVLALVREDLAASLPAGAALDSTAQFVSGGLTQLLGQALDARTPAPVDEFEARLLALVGPILHAERRRGARG